MPNQPDRHHAIERLLREGLAAAPPATDGRCVTPEELAAWLDGGLPETQAARVEAHVASCSTCQEVLGSYAVTEPEAPSSRLPGMARAVMPFAAAAVLVVGVWLGTREPQPQPPSAGVITERQAARRDTPAVAVPPAPAVATPSQSADQPPQPTQFRSDSSSARRAAAPAPRDAAAEVPRPEVAAPPAELQRTAERQATAPVTAAPAAPPAAANVAEADDARARAADTQLRQEAAGPSPQRAQAEAVSGVAARTALLAKAADARVPVASPDGASRWRIVGAALETSADGGNTWFPASGVTAAELANVTSGASPARGVNWLVGRGGLVLVTADGRRFTRATPPAAAVLTGVRAVDEMAAEVRAADGRAWRTTDAGRTWMPVR